MAKPAKPANPTLVTLVLSVAAVLGYVAYRFTIADGSPPPAPEQASEAEHYHADLADTLPDFSLADLDGEMRSIQEWSGQPLIVNFWATWCEPCRREIPMLKAFHEEHPGITVLGVAVEQPDPVRAYAEEAQFNYPVLIGQQSGIDAASAFGVELYAMPVTIFTDAAGGTLGARIGEVHAEHLDEYLAVLDALQNGTLDRDGARARIHERM